MPERPTDGGTFPEDRYEHPEAALGGADAVEKTTYVAGKGAGPEGRRADDVPTARVAPLGAKGATWAVLAFFFVGAVLVYLLGYGR